MEITKTLQPGDMGTLNLVEQYGEQLICVRYRVDETAKKRYTTVELVVAEKEYKRRTPSVQVLIKVKYEETSLRERIKSTGARWVQEEKAWLVDYRTAVKMKLKDRIIKKVLKVDV